MCCGFPVSLSVPIIVKQIKIPVTLSKYIGGFSKYSKEQVPIIVIIKYV